MSGSKKPNYFALMLSCLCGIEGFAQNCFNVSGGSSIINGMQFEHSIGEMALITTERNTDLVVSQGFQQPIQQNANASIPTATNTEAYIHVNVYPNPTLNILYIESYEYADAGISYQLYDASGKLILSGEIEWKKGLNKLSIDLGEFAAGSYYLFLKKPGADSLPANFTYKIQKTN